MRGCDSMASKKDIEDVVYKLLEPILTHHEFECVDLEFVKELGNAYLRVYLDKPEGININDCEIVSRELEAKLDSKDPIKDPYILEVSSPGLDRPLKKDKDFDRHMGDLVELKLYKAVEKVKDFTGELLAYTPDTVTVLVDDETMEFNRKDIAIIRLAVIF
jgi:ribosome maturation factor RimP